MSAIGSAQDRIDGPLKVTGQAKYPGDYQPANLAYGYLITSRIAKGKIESIDTEEANASPGVVAIYTPFNPLKLYSPLGREEGANSGTMIAPLQNENIYHYGQIIGLVVANSFEQARDAASLLRVVYAEKKPVIRWKEAVPFIPSEVDRESGVVTILAEGVPSIEAALAGSEVQIDVTYTEPILHHNPMEPHATTAAWDGDRLTIYDATQWVQGQQRDVAAVLGVDEAKVRVICPFVGGAFGCKGSMWMHSPLTAAAARALNRPVKTVLTREQMFTLVGHRPALVQKISLGANHDGALQAVKHNVDSTVAVTKLFVEPAAHRSSRVLYKCPNIVVYQKVVPLDIGAPTFMRAPGAAPGMFALECAMDELAVKLGIDPLTLRMKNYAEVFPGTNLPWSSKNLEECYRLGAERFGWSKRNPNPKSSREGDWLIGVGMGSSLYPAHRSPASAKVRLMADGSVQISSATHDLGTGMWTVIALIGADTLGLPIDRVHPDLGDSALPLSPGAGGSQTTGSVGPAIKSAAVSAKKKLLQLAIQHPKSPFKDSKDVSYERGKLIGGGMQMEFAGLLNVIDRASIEATESASAGAETKTHEFHSFGAQFCEVKVNQWTGETRVSRVTAVMDAGKIVNPKTARSQIMGGVVFGIGMALLEGSWLEDNGRYANANLSEYLIPTNADVLRIDVSFLDKPDLIFNTIGARGIGEIGVTGIPAAIANAVYNATGVRVRDFPIRPERLISQMTQQA
ncbi:MAG: xanthine dehydrogenase family protein molybdopterin-binding subunit [Verrucomicrobia bacterium]|nr:xanthine dehydrogenase family protein molybdopterin-binding subunit [Verrucomicrobiota bacterium]